jgi:hypothetical protein
MTRNLRIAVTKSEEWAYLGGDDKKLTIIKIENKQKPEIIGQIDIQSKYNI